MLSYEIENCISNADIVRGKVIFHRIFIRTHRDCITHNSTEPFVRTGSTSLEFPISRTIKNLTFKSTQKPFPPPQKKKHRTNSPFQLLSFHFPRAQNPTINNPLTARNAYGQKNLPSTATFTSVDGGKKKSASRHAQVCCVARGARARVL